MGFTGLDYYRVVDNRNGWILGLPNVGEAAELLRVEPPDPYAESVAPKFPIGTIAQRGRDAFIYCKNAAVALSTLGVPIQAAARIHTEADDDIVVVSGALAGTAVTLTSTANLVAAPLSTKDGFAEGYLIVNNNAGEGQMYQIKGHEAASGTTNFIVTLYEALTVLLTTSSKVGLVQHPCSNVIAVTAPLTGVPMGVPLLAITASYYFWSKIRGYAPVVAQEAIVVGKHVCVGETAAKANGHDATDTNTMHIVIGVAQTPGVTDTESFICDLTLL